MNITSTPSGSASRLALKGRFDAHEVPAFKEALAPLIAGGGDVELDLGAVGFLDSSALAELLRCRTLLDRKGAELRFITISDPVRVIFELTGLSSVFLADADSDIAGHVIGR